MKILKKAIGRKYRTTCWECGSIFEADESDLKYKSVDYIKVNCPVCEIMRTYERDGIEVKEIILYEGEEDS